jgi:7-cyano-7-deazaguanine synthase
MSATAQETVVVLLGAGIESTTLVRRFLDSGRDVLPVHVHCGLIWDDCEREFARRYCREMENRSLAPLVEISLSLQGYLGNHWAVTGRDVPAAGAASAELELPLRNLTLLSFTLSRLRTLARPVLALGTTADNSYRDGSRNYFDLCQQLLSLEAGRPVTILTPLMELSKPEVIARAHPRDLALSFSCVNPRSGRHCGACIKCGRRRESFRAAGVHDPTDYDPPAIREG